MSGPPRPDIGIVEWFHVGSHDRVERVLEQLRRLGVEHLRTGVSWADWHTERGGAWYDWLIPRLARDVELLPCFLYTPPSLGIAPRSSSPPREPKAYADFLDLAIERYGRHFGSVELWNEPNSPAEWDWTLDPEWRLFSEMVGGAAHWAKRLGKRTVLGGMSPIDPNWLELMFARGVMEHIDVVGIHGFPGTWESGWDGWDDGVHRVREVLDRHGSSASVWITETGYSTVRHGAMQQIRAFVEAADAPVERMYWYGAEDLSPDLAAVARFHEDEREYHFGIATTAGEPKLLGRLWAEGGIEGVRASLALSDDHRSLPPSRATVITGGAGFVGTNLADRLLGEGERVVIVDNLARPGVEQNLRWLRERHGDRVSSLVTDIRDEFELRRAIRSAGQVFHFAAQVAVTTSLTDPVGDFDVNLAGTLKVLEEVRRLDDPPPLLFTSTNKVYGALPDVELTVRGQRYEPDDDQIHGYGIGEDRPLDFHSPYGCSKGGADQYVLDYAKSFGLPTLVFRMSCIYGPHQFGTEDQGWVAHFLIRALRDEPITLYGDGKQVRDILYVDDLVDAMLLAMTSIDDVAGRAFNIGGGPDNSVSLLEVVDLISEIHGVRPELRFGDWRTGDQRYYVSDTRRFGDATGWKPQTTVPDGIERLYRWLRDNRVAASTGMVVR